MRILNKSNDHIYLTSHKITIHGKDIRTLNATWFQSNVVEMINQVENTNEIISFLELFTY